VFQKRYEEFNKPGRKLTGMSIDQVFFHIKWVQWVRAELDIEIKFPIIVAVNGSIAMKLGGNMDEAVRAVNVLQISDKQGAVAAG
jgi:peroxiredoxin (alkyl hydroperoxide reductase subunit C)